MSYRRMWDMTEFKKCGGYKGNWECATDYPDHMVPIGEFGISNRDGLQNYCRRCRVIGLRVLNERISIGERLVGGRKKWRGMAKEERDEVYVQVEKARILNTEPAQEYFDWVDSQKESVVKQRVVSIKSRNSSEYTRLKELYNYTCQVEGCYETEVQFAHILKHSLPNSVDNHTNGWCICCNHHNAYDSNRMIVDVDGNFVRYDVHGDKVEEGRIIYHDRHEVDPQFIILAREWHDNTKKQAVG